MELVFVWNHLSGGMASLRQDNHLQIFGATVTSMGEGEGVNSLWLGQFYVIYFRNLPARAFLTHVTLKGTRASSTDSIIISFHLKIAKRR